MIVDRIDRFEKYFKNSAAMEKIGNFLKSLSPQMSEREYELAGRDIFVRVMSYHTVARAEARLEAHRAYVDIQTTLSGSELIEWCPREGLVVQMPYDQGTDVEFFHTPERVLSGIRIEPGIFSLFFPEDAHMPKLMDGKTSERVIKAVVKINVDILKVC